MSEVVFERRAPWWVPVVALALLGLTFGMVPVVEPPVGSALDRFKDAAEKGFGHVAVTGGGFVLIATPLVLLILFVAWAYLRYGRCVVARDHAVFEIPFVSRLMGPVAVAYTEVTERTVTPRSVQLRCRTQPLGEVHGPFVIPVADEAEAERVVALLDACEPRPDDPPPVVAGSFRPRRSALLVLAVVAACTVGPAFVAWWRFGPDTRQDFGMSVAFGSVPQLLLVIVLAARAKELVIRRRLLAGQEAILVGDVRVLYRDLEAVAAADGFFAVVARGRRRVTWVGRAELAAATSALAERLRAVRPDLVLAGEAPRWATPGADRRRLALALVASVLLAAPLAASELSNGWTMARDLDFEGHSLALYRRRGERRPRLLVLETRGIARVGTRTSLVAGVLLLARDEGDVLADLAAGRFVDGRGTCAVSPSATIVHVTSQSRIVSTRPVPSALLDALEKGIPRHAPEWLETVLPAPADPVLSDFESGRTSRRCYDLLDGSGERLLAGVDEGHVVFVAVLPAFRDVDVSIEVLSHSSRGTKPTLKLRGERGRFFSVAPDGTLQASSRALPSFDELLGIVDSVRSGQSIAVVRSSLAPAR